MRVCWDDVPDLSGMEDRDQLLKLLMDAYPEVNPKTVKNWESQLWAFVRRFKKDDLAALPLKTQSAVAFGRITEDCRYASDAPPEARHQRPVEWINTDIVRNKLDADLRYSLGGAMTVFSVHRNNAEARIRTLLDGKPTTKRETRSRQQSIFSSRPTTRSSILSAGSLRDTT